MGERPRRPPPTLIDHHDLSLDEELRNHSSSALLSSQSTNNFSVILLLVIIIILLINNGDRSQLLSSDVMSSQLPWRTIESKYIPALDHHDLERITLLNQSVSALRSRLYSLERKNDKQTTDHIALTERLHQHNVTLSAGKQNILQKWQQHQQKANEDSIVFITSVETQLERLRSKVDDVVRMNQQTQQNESEDNERANAALRRIAERVEVLEARVTAVKDLESVLDVNAKDAVLKMDVMVNDAVLKVWHEEGEPRLMDALMKATTSHSHDIVGNDGDKVIENDIHNDDDVQELINPMLSTVSTPHWIDFAALRSGGIVLHDLTSPTFVPKHLQFNRLVTSALRPWLGDSLSRALVGCIPSVDLLSGFRMLGLDVGVGTPEDALSSDMSLGSCWPMQGSGGVLVVKLPQPVVLSHVTIEHLHWSQAIDLRSAPRAFAVYAAPTPDGDAFRLMVEGEYRIDGGVGQPYSPAQVFSVQDVDVEGDYKAGGNAGKGSVQKATRASPNDDDAGATRGPVQYVALRVQSNHGHEEFTCMYRFRVHGQPQQS